MEMVVVVVVMVSGVEWMREGGRRAGAAYMVIGGGGRLPGKSIFDALSSSAPQEHQSHANLPALQLQNHQSPTRSRRPFAIGSLGARPNWEGARALIWKARPCVALIRRASVTHPAAS
jgi:hypothetical protein